MLRATGRLQALHSQLSQSRAGTGTNTAASSSRPSTASASDGSAKKVRLALIGCGSICHAHLNGLNALAAEHIQVTACIDPSERADEMAALVGQTAAGGGDTPRTFASLTEALAAGAELFDAVDIMLPHNLHRPVALEAMQGGKHVLLEKPMAPTLEDAQAILDAAAAMPLEHVFMMAENSQYWPEVLAAKELIAAGAIGELVSGRGWHHGAHTPDGDWAKRGVNGEEAPAWRFSKEIMGGGVVVDGGAHWIRPLRILLGEVEQVVGTTAYPVSDYEGESLGRALLRHASGVSSVYEASVLPEGAAFGPMAAGWQVIGTKGEIRVDAGSVGAGSVMLWTGDSPEGKDVSPPPTPGVEIVDIYASQNGESQPCSGYASSFGYELKDFAEAILNGKPIAVPVEDSEKSQPEHSLGEMRTAQALYRSVESETWEDVW